MRVREDYRALSGPEKAAILLMSLGDEHASKMFALMSDDEIKEISQTMANGSSTFQMELRRSGSGAPSR